MQILHLKWWLPKGLTGLDDSNFFQQIRTEENNTMCDPLKRGIIILQSKSLPEWTLSQMMAKGVKNNVVANLSWRWDMYNTSSHFSNKNLDEIQFIDLISNWNSKRFNWNSTFFFTVQSLGGSEAPCCCITTDKHWKSNSTNISHEIKFSMTQETILITGVRDEQAPIFTAQKCQPKSYI